jgi:hypothetical protein
MSGVEMGERLLVSSSGLRALLYPMFRSYPQTQEEAVPQPQQIK